MMESNMKKLTLAFDNIEAIRYINGTSIDDIINFVGKGNIMVCTGFSDNSTMETRLVILGDESYNGYSEVIKPGEWILKINGYLDFKTNDLKSKFMVMSDLMVKTLFMK